MSAPHLALLIGVVASGCGRSGFDQQELVDAPCTLAIDAGPSRMNFHSRRTIAITSAVEPVDIVVTDLVTFDASSSVLSSFDIPGEVTINASDAAGCSAEARLTVGGDTMWYVGGSSMSVPSAQVWRTTDGTTWTNVGSLPGPRVNGAVAVFHDRLWYIAGSNDGSTYRTEVFASDDGIAWAQVGQVPTGATSFGFTVGNGAMWLVGGNNNANRVYRSTDGTVWTMVGMLPMNNHGGSLARLGGALIYTGGHDGSLYNWVLASPDDGATWTQVSTLAVAREYHSAITVDGRMYVVGGQNTTPAALASVASTADGVTWQTEPSLPGARAFGPVARFGGAIWSLGGTNTAGVYSMVPGSSWSPIGSNFPIPRQGGGAAVFTPLGM